MPGRAWNVGKLDGITGDTDCCVDCAGVGCCLVVNGLGTIFDSVGATCGGRDGFSDGVAVVSSK